MNDLNLAALALLLASPVTLAAAILVGLGWGWVDGVCVLCVGLVVMLLMIGRLHHLVEHEADH